MSEVPLYAQVDTLDVRCKSANLGAENSPGLAQWWAKRLRQSEVSPARFRGRCAICLFEGVIKISIHIGNTMNS